MLIGMDVHKHMVNITEMEDDGSVKENYEIENSVKVGLFFPIFGG